VEQGRRYVERDMGNKQTLRDREGTRGEKKRKGKSEEEGETGQQWLQQKAALEHGSV
jgi:hypothetical protein